jgi:hypothetical protein
MAGNPKHSLHSSFFRATSLVVCLTLLLPSPAYSQVGEEVATQGLNGLGQGISQGLSNTSIANGTQNQNQGQQTQNMAQMAMGAMQILMGLLGLLAAAGMGKNGAKAGNNASGLSGMGSDPYSSPYGTSPTGSSPNDPGSSNVGTSNTGGASTKPAGATVSISPSDLRTGSLGAAMDGLEKNYGLPRDKVLEALQNGVDPKTLLANAPKNAPSADMLNKIADGLASSNSLGQDAAARLLASAANGGANAGIGNAGGGGASAAGTPTGDKSTDAATAGGPKAPSASVADDLEENIAKVSPEVKAALAAKAAADMKGAQEPLDVTTWSIFQLVHHRYKKLETMLYGRVERTNPSPTAGVKGF